MPALAPVPPAILKAIIEACGYAIEGEDPFNWVLLLKEQTDSLPKLITLPKEGKFVSVEIMMSILDRLKMNNATFFSLLQTVSKPRP